MEYPDECGKPNMYVYENFIIRGNKRTINIIVMFKEILIIPHTGAHTNTHTHTWAHTHTDAWAQTHTIETAIRI